MSEVVPHYDGKPLSVLKTPVTLTAAQASQIESTLAATLRNVEEFTKTVLSKERKLLTLMGLPEDLDPRPTPLGLHIPFARFDFTFDGKDIQILELNTDGTSGYNVTEWLAEQAGIPEKENPNYRFSERLLRAIREHKPDAQEVALVDFLDVKTAWEQDDLIRRWRPKAQCRRADPRFGDWNPSTIVYRRALSWQLRARRAEVQAFLKAWADGLTVVGGWSSDIGMNKAWPSFLKGPENPETVLLTADNIRRLEQEKDAWVLKGAMSYSGNAVIRGKDKAEPRWKASLEKTLEETLAGRPWVAQRLVEIPLVEGEPCEYGLYFLNGQAAGYMCRWGHTQVISDTSTEVARPVRII